LIPLYFRLLAISQVEANRIRRGLIWAHPMEGNLCDSDAAFKPFGLDFLHHT
jgi:hypothetical protein